MDQINLDLFELLDAGENCSQEDLKSKCQALLLKHHPDKNGGNESELFLSVKTAWKILSSSESWHQYLAQRSHSSAKDDRPVWKTVFLSDLVKGSHGYSYSCRCGGEFEVDVEDLELDSNEDTDLVLDCDTCSLEIVVQLGPR